MWRDHSLLWCSCHWDHPSTVSSGFFLSAFLAPVFPCSPVIFAWGKYDQASQSLVCNYFACGVMSKLPEVCLRIFISSACLLSHSVLNSYWTHDILCTLLHNVFFFTFVPLCMVFSLPGTHYPSLFSTRHISFSSKIEYRHHSSRNLPLTFSLFIPR